MRNLPSIRTKLALVVLACIIPTIAGFGILFYHFYQHAYTQFEQNTLATTRAMTLAVDRDLSSSKTAALALATSPYLAQNNFSGFHAQAKSLLGSDFPGFNFVLSDATAQQLVNTLRPFGEALPRHGLPDQVQHIFKSGKPVVSDLFFGGVLRSPTLAVEVPVWKNGKVVYSLAVGILPEKLGTILAEQQLPPDQIAVILDSKGVVVARTQDAQKFVGQQASPSLLKQVRDANEGKQEGTTLEGIPVYFFYNRSTVSGWTVAIGVPKSIVHAALWSSIAWFGGTALVLCAVGFLGAWYIGGTIQRPIIALASPLDSSDQTKVFSKSFKEAEIVAEELARQRHLVEERSTQLTLDITERRRTEEKLRVANVYIAEKERFLRLLINNLPGMVAYWDRELRCRFSNMRYIEWFGKTPQEMVGMRIQDLLGERIFALNEPYLRSALRGEPQNFERILVKPNGAIRSMWANYIPDINMDGHVVGIVAVVSDVTILKQAEEVQRIAATAFESSEAMMITDANTLILRVNQAFSELTGYSANDIVGQKPRILKSGRHDKSFYDAMWKSILDTGSWKGEIWDRHKSGNIFPCWETITAVKDEKGTITHYVATQTDITERKAAENEIGQLAFFDVLTGLPNRRLFMDRLRHTYATCLRTGRNGALMFIDLDNFKNLNDTLGHDKGDLLLQQVAQRLSSCVRKGDTVARLGGDEFMVILDTLSGVSEEASLQTEVVGDKILTALDQPYDLNGLPYRCTSSIGLTLFTDHECGIEELLKRADIAMYQAKAAGRNTLRFFDEKIQAIVTAHATLDAEFRQGLLRNEFVLHFQAQVDDANHLTGVEALVRWRHPQRGILLPAEFIPLAEETGLILPLGQWVLETACMQLAAWGTQPGINHITIAVNVSAFQFRSPSYVEHVLKVIEETGANPHKLKLEITESLLLDDVEEVIKKMTTLKSHGVSFSLDDFGTGYSSLSYLQRLPLDQLKIDYSFVVNMLTDQNDATIASAIVALGQNLKLEVIAEGVETEAQRLFLADHNCKAYQGFLFSQPLPLQEFENWMQFNCA